MIPVLQGFNAGAFVAWTKLNKSYLHHVNGIESQERAKGVITSEKGII